MNWEKVSNKAEETVFVDNQIWTAMCANCRRMKEKSSFEKPELAEDGNNLVKKYHQTTCFWHN